MLTFLVEQTGGGNQTTTTEAELKEIKPGRRIFVCAEPIDGAPQAGRYLLVTPEERAAILEAGECSVASDTVMIVPGGKSNPHVVVLLVGKGCEASAFGEAVEGKTLQGSVRSGAGGAPWTWPRDA
jgi:hypothetical protein